MDSGGQFERLIRLVQDTGERVVVSLGLGKDPVVLLPLSTYEKLVQEKEREEKREGRAFVASVSQSSALSPSPSFSLPPLSQHLSAGPRTSYRAPDLSPEDFSHEPADVWDGEGGGDYDAERIFASAAVQNGFKPPSSSSESVHPTSNRLQASISRASEAYGRLQQEAWCVGKGGQRLPIQGGALKDEERFSLGMG
ncbi:type II toxin-antitoxin system Phd/YefM family antitoxin [bacterium]|nr:type II toxin-antitoxin system Phd/YefM family antitoxin [bacterium]NBX49835.1 type II toxin-antitoxin system Phd/YefM family antitoxin [bacterium]